MAELSLQYQDETSMTVNAPLPFLFSLLDISQFKEAVLVTDSKEASDWAWRKSRPGGETIEGVEI